MSNEFARMSLGQRLHIGLDHWTEKIGGESLLPWLQMSAELKAAWEAAALNMLVEAAVENGLDESIAEVLDD